MRDHFDNAHGVLAVSFISATMSGWTVQDWAACAALIYSCLLIARFFYRGVKSWRDRTQK
jgi:hypothetical protein